MLHNLDIRACCLKKVCHRESWCRHRPGKAWICARGLGLAAVDAAFLKCRGVKRRTCCGCLERLCSGDRLIRCQRDEGAHVRRRPGIAFIALITLITLITLISLRSWQPVYTW